VTTPDPSEQSRWHHVFLLLDAMNADIARIYTERGITGVRPRFVGPLIRLGRRGGMTIRALADSLDVTHSAMSQTVAALQRDGLVTTVSGADARTREVVLTDRARELLPLLEAEWRATEEAVAELDAEVPYALSQVAHDLEAALARRSFHDRIADRLDRREP
jgi:DNA-binding MarR family transcriptional regulator